MHDQFTEDGIVLDNALAFWVHRVYQAGRNEMFRSFREEGEEITPEQWIVLVRLWEADGRTQTDLGNATFHDRPTMSRILDVMQRRGLLERRPDKSHKRVWNVFLTPRGKALRRRLIPRARQIVDKMLRGIPQKDLEITRTTLRKVFANVEGDEQ